MKIKGIDIRNIYLLLLVIIMITLLIIMFLNIDSNLFSALVGSLIGGVLSIVTMYLQKKWDQEGYEKQRKEQINSFVKAINSEVSIIQDRYNDTIGNKIAELKEEEFLNLYYEISEGYFSVYENNTNILGNL